MNRSQPSNKNVIKVARNEVGEAWRDLNPVHKGLALASLGMVGAASYVAVASETPIKAEMPVPATCGTATVQEGSSQLEAAGLAYIDAAENIDESLDISVEDATHTVNSHVRNTTTPGEESPLSYASAPGVEIAVCLNDRGRVESVTPIHK